MLAIGLGVLSFIVRLKDLTHNSLGGDEATVLKYTQGVLERGYPSLVIDGEVKVAHTSELIYYAKSLFVWLLGPNPLGLRFADLIFGTLTVLAFYWVGRLLHGRALGLLAAALYTILPSAIVMTHYGRYPSQLQFFALVAFGLVFRAFGEDRFRPLYYYLATAAFIAGYLSWEGAAFYLPSLALGVFVLTRPNFQWLKSGHVWMGIGIIVALLYFQLGLRFIDQANRQVYGTGAADVGLAFAWLYPFYRPTEYLQKFFGLENHHLLTLLFVLGIPLWFRRSREGRILGFMGVTLSTDLFFMTNFLEISHWRYVYYLLPLLILSASLVLVIFLEYLGTLCRSGQMAPHVMSGIGRVAAVLIVGAVLLFSTTFVVKLYNVSLSKSSQGRFSMASQVRPGIVTFPAMKGAVAYLREHFMPGDVVIAVNPHTLQVYGAPSHYFVQTRLRLSLLLGSDPSLPNHRIAGVPVILSANELREVMARSSRVWYVSYDDTTLAVDQDVSDIVQNSMQLVYEDIGVAVFFFGGRWPFTDERLTNEMERPARQGQP